MKKLKNLILLLTFFSLTNFVNSQGIKVKVIDATGIERWIDYVPTGITQAQLDAAVGTRALQSFVNTSFTNLQTWASNSFVLKGSVGGTGASYGNVVNLPYEKWVTEIRPADYGVTYADGHQQGAYFGEGLSNNPGVNLSFGDSRTNIVRQISAYNMDVAGNVKLNDGGWRIAVETHYNISREYLANFEHHMLEWVDWNGFRHRNSSYNSKFSGTTLFNISANLWQLHSFDPITRTERTLYSITDGMQSIYATQNQLGTQYLNTQGFRVAYMTWTGGVPMINMGRKFYATNADAKAAGFKPGEEYATRINGILVIGIVE